MCYCSLIWCIGPSFQALLTVEDPALCDALFMFLPIFFSFGSYAKENLTCGNMYQHCIGPHIKGWTTHLVSSKKRGCTFRNPTSLSLICFDQRSAESAEQNWRRRFNLKSRIFHILLSLPWCKQRCWRVRPVILLCRSCSWFITSQCLLLRQCP